MRSDLLGASTTGPKQGRGPLVLEAAFDRGQIAVDGVGHDGMDEADGVVVAQYFRPSERRDGTRGRGFGQVDQGRYVRQLRRPAQDGDAARDAMALLGHPAEAQEYLARHCARTDRQHGVRVRRIRFHVLADQR